MGASIIFGVIGLIWSGFTVTICAVATNFISDINAVIAEWKNDADYVLSLHLDFISQWLKWILGSLWIMSMLKFMSNLELMYGIIGRKPTFVKHWLLLGFVEIFLIFWAFLFEMYMFIYLSDENTSVSGTALSWITFGFMPLLFLKVCLWRMVFKVHKDLKKEEKDKRAFNRLRFANSLHQDDIEIAKAKGQYMKF